MNVINFIKENKIKDYPIIAVIATLLVINMLSATPLFKDYDKLCLYAYKINYYLRYFCVFLFIYYYLVERTSKNQLYIFIAFVVLDFLFKKLANNHLLFELFFVPFCLAQFVRREVLFKILFFTAIITFFSILLLYNLEILQPELFYRGDKIRYTFGFSHPNPLGFNVFYVALLYCFSKEHNGYFSIGILFILCIFNYLIPRSVTSSSLIFIFALSLILLNSVRFSNFFERNNNRLYFCVLFFLFAVVSLSYLIAFSEIGKEFLLKMPGSIWARFELGKIAYERYGLSLFGTPIVEIFPDPVKNITEYFVVDCAYFYLPINYGVIFSIIFFILFIYILKISVNKKEYKLLFVMLIMILYGVSELLILMPIMMPIYAYVFCKSEKSIKRIKIE